MNRLPRLLTPNARRLLRMEKLLQHGRVVDIAEFRKAVHTSPATFKRDLDLLRIQFGAPIVYDPAQRGYRLTAPWTGVAKALTEQLEAA